MKKILGVILLILGVGIFSFGNHISDEVSQGEERVSQAEENEQDHNRPVLGPVRRNVRESTSQTAEQKISAAEQKLAASQVTAHWLHGTGIAVFAIGISCLALSFSHKKRD